MTQNEIDAKQVISLIEEYRGNVSAVAQKIGCARNTLYAFIEKRPTCQAALANSREKMVDNVESVLYSQALAGEAWAVCFFLKTQAKHRGYVERVQQEVSGKDGGELVIRFVNDWRNPEERNG